MSTIHSFAMFCSRLLFVCIHLWFHFLFVAMPIRDFVCNSLFGVDGEFDIIFFRELLSQGEISAPRFAVGLAQSLLLCWPRSPAHAIVRSQSGARSLRVELANQFGERSAIDLADRHIVAARWRC